MTDAPNFGTKFGWRKPCLRYIGPLLGTTCVAPVGAGVLDGPLLHTASIASVGRGDHTPPPRIPFRNLAGGSHTPGAPRRRPPCSVAPPVGGGLCPAPLARSVFAPIFRWFGIPSTPCPGGPMCPPADDSRKGPFPGRHIGPPLQNLHQLLENRAGTHPRPYRAPGAAEPPRHRGLLLRGPQVQFLAVPLGFDELPHAFFHGPGHHEVHLPIVRLALLRDLRWILLHNIISHIVYYKM